MTSPNPWSCVLWDVDGTIIDASDDILRRLGVAMRRYGHPEVTRDELVHWIGPPVLETFQKLLGMTPDEATEAVDFFRELAVRDGATAGARVYAGVGELIADLAAAGIPQATASSKPEVQVKELMKHFDLTKYFTTLVGAGLDERALGAKADIVAETLRRLAAAGIDTSRPVLIGDRDYDVKGAAVHGVPVIFVNWGFSSPGESVGAVAVADTVDELRALLMPAGPGAGDGVAAGRHG